MAATADDSKKKSKWGVAKKFLTNKSEGEGPKEIQTGVCILGCSAYLNDSLLNSNIMPAREWRAPLPENTILRICFYGLGVKSDYDDNKAAEEGAEQRSRLFATFSNCKKKKKKGTPESVCECAAVVLVFLKRDRGAFDHITKVLMPEILDAFGGHVPVFLIGASSVMAIGKEGPARDFLVPEEVSKHVTTAEGTALAEDLAATHYMDLDLDTSAGIATLANGLVAVAQAKADPNKRRDAGGCSVM